ncbi:antA/AntB antirepressor family protein [Leuconostoc mesenteroides]|uniref:antA/AntB antirepressor family protein n=1 Tax=Leuconostoc mesenteroides TaxID=1245 RepID=UPI00235E95FD|nr:antA/AntB antirepressor family protein [Leuconostoc mesenteroides]
MQEIIKINQNEQGEAQVSARELYQALEVKKSYRFSQWFETNAKQLIENEDFTSVDATTVAQKSINWTIFIQLIRRHLRYDCDYKN